MDEISGYLGGDQRDNKAFWDRVKAFQATLPHDAALYSQTAPYQPHPVAASTNAMRDWLMPHILPYLLNYGFYQMQEPKQAFGADILPANEFAKRPALFGAGQVLGEVNTSPTNSRSQGRRIGR